MNIKPQVVVCGDNCLNIVLHTSQPLQRGSNIEVEREVQRPGGNALVTAMALSSWGINSRYFGVIGTDSAAKTLQAWMDATGIDNDGVVIRKINTRVSYAIVDNTERTILDLRNPSKELSELQITDWERTPDIRNEIYSAKIVMLDKYCAQIHNRVKEIFLDRRNRGENSLLAYRTGSRGSASLQIESGILPWVDIAFTKESFLSHFGLEAGPLEACKRFSQRFAIPLVVATLGTTGAAYFQAQTGKSEIVDAYPVKKPATTLSAGDFFRAGFLMGYLEGKSIQESVYYGNVAAALHCERPESENPEVMFFPRDEIDNRAKLSQI